MGERPPDDRLNEFQSRIDRLKGAQAVRTGQRGAPSGPTSGYGMAFTIAADLVGGLVGGAVLGWLVDRWLGSAPVGLIAFFFLGAIAGMWNVYRTVRGYDMSFGFRPPATPGAKPEQRGETKTPAGARPADESGDHRGQSPPSVPGREDHPDPDRRD